MTVDFAKEYLLDDCEDCTENENGECMTQSHCFEVKRMAIQALEHTRWIPVSEKLPEDGTYLVCTDDCYIATIMYDCSMGWLLDANIIAYMQLPQPYKGESEGEE